MRNCFMSQAPKKHLKHGPIFWIATISGVLITVTVLMFVDLKSLHAHAERLNGVVLFALMSLLPLVGVPVSILYVVAGAKFGPVWGLASTAAAISLHLIGYYWVAHSWLQGPLDRLFKRTRYHKPQIPEGEYVPVCLLVSLMPGVPYTVKNYLLVLGGVPFRQYFWTCLPAHFLTSSVGILFGDFTSGFTAGKIIFLVCYAAVLSGLSLYVVRRLRARKELSVAALTDD
jgi:uncharacterized membrane protein YdjX (TVP38/TMEM64 family)